MAITAEFSATTSREGFAPLSVEFQDDTTGGTPVYRRWTFGDGTQVENVANPSHSYAEAGIYNVTLHVRDSGGFESTEVKSQFVIVNGVYAISENTIIQSQEAGTSPGWVEFSTYLYDDFSSGVIGTQYSSAMQSDWQVVYEGSDYLAIPISPLSAASDLLEPMQMVSGDFIFEFDLIDRGALSFVPGFTARFGWSGPYVSISRWDYTPWGLKWNISDGALLEYVPWAYVAGTRTKFRMTRVSGTVRMEYNIGGGWAYFSNTYYNTQDVRIILNGSSTGCGFDFLKLQAESGFPTPGDPSRYWRFYIDENLHLCFRKNRLLYKTIDPAAALDEWMLIEFHPGEGFFYLGTAEIERKIIPSSVADLGTIPSVSDNRIFVARNSSMQIDELKAWSKEVSLRSYYRGLKAQAYLLNQENE